MAELEKIIQQQKQKTFDEELDLLLPKHTPETIDEILDKVPTPSSSSLSETESENSSQDNPFYSKITDHLMAHDGSYRFQCQDEDDTARVWCDYGKAVINVGRKTMHQYIRKNSLEKQRYQPVVDKPRMKSNTRKTANKKQLNASKEVKLFKVVKSKKTNEGTMYKVERSDSSKVWLKVDELYDYPHLLQEFRQENKEKEKARKRKRRSQNKSNKDNDGTSGQVKKTTRNKKTNPKAAKVANPKKHPSKQRKGKLIYRKTRIKHLRLEMYHKHSRRITKILFLFASYTIYLLNHSKPREIKSGFLLTRDLMDPSAINAKLLLVIVLMKKTLCQKYLVLHIFV